MKAPKLAVGSFSGDHQEALYWLERRWALIAVVCERLAHEPGKWLDDDDVLSVLAEIAREAEDVTEALIDSGKLEAR